MKVAPSILSLDYSKFNEQLEVLNKNAEFLHFDVMDGHFVPNLSFGPHIFSFFRKNSKLFMDVHLMCTNPEDFVEVFAKEGADGITFHFEACDDLEECRKMIELIRSFYIKVGISIKPKTRVEEILPLLPDLDLVLVMSVEPGFGGQSFIPSSLDKIKELAAIRHEFDYSYLIEVDGGVKYETAKPIIEAGADILVAGSYVFKGDIESNIRSIMKLDNQEA